MMRLVSELHSTMDKWERNEKRTDAIVNRESLLKKMITDCRNLCKKAVYVSSKKGCGAFFLNTRVEYDRNSDAYNNGVQIAADLVRLQSTGVFDLI